MACKSSNLVEQDKERGEKAPYEDDRNGKERNKESPANLDQQIEQIYHIATEPPTVPKTRKDSKEKKLEKSKSEDSDDFKMQINSFYDNLYRMKNDLAKQTKPKSRWVKIIKEREF